MTKRPYLTSLTLVALLLAAGTCLAGAGEIGVGPSCVTTTCSKCVYIDLFDGANTTEAPSGSPWILPNINNGKGVSVGALVKGQTYLITVTGWVSYWFRSRWEINPNVGIPASAPMYYSNGPGAPPQAEQTRAGYDWHCLFAYPQPLGTPLINLPLPYPSNRLSLDGGATFIDPEHTGGLPCAPDHTYRYLIVGKGMESYFRITDTGPTYDNYGKYKICVQAVCCDSPECANLVPASAEVSPAFMTDGAFDPRLSSDR